MKKARSFRKKKTSFVKRVVVAAMTLVMVLPSSFTGMVSNAEGTAYVIQDKSPDQLMAEYGLIAFDTLNIQAHCHSNFLTKILNGGSNSGLNLHAEYPAEFAENEAFYFYDFTTLNEGISAAPQLGHLYVGKGVSAVSKNANETYLTNSAGTTIKVAKPQPANISWDNDASKPYANMLDIQKKMAGYSKDISKKSSTGAVTQDWTQNSEKITCPAGQSVWNLTSGDIDHIANSADLKVVFPTDDSTSSVVFNIDMKGRSSINIKQLRLAYADTGTTISNREINAGSNHNRIYWNFYDSSEIDNQYKGTIDFAAVGIGTIIAPCATFKTGSNWDGVVVADTITFNGEYHRIVKAIGAPTAGSTSVTPTYTGTLEISKVSLTDGLPELPGATLALYAGKYPTGKPQGTPQDSWVSTSVPHPYSWRFSDNTVRYYTLYEEAAPNGYQVATNITFCIEKGVVKDVSGAHSYVPKTATTNAKIIMADVAGVTNPDGTITYPDGSVKNPDGTITYPDGRVKNPDGTITYPDGRVESPDGTITYPSGKIEKPDGTVIYPNGNVQAPDGTVTTVTGTVKDPDGTVSHPDGSITKPDGTFVDTDGTTYAPDPATPKDPMAEYAPNPTDPTQTDAYGSDRTPTPDISSSDEDDEDFMKEVASKGSNKQDQKNANKALKNAGAIKTGDDSSVFASEKKVVQTKLGAKNTSKVSKKLNSSLKKYRKIHKKQAKQIAGWIKINGTNVNYPVMYSGLKHNDKYLHKNIYGKDDNHGMIFASYLTTSRKISYNYIIYGHNMKDETMFGNLDNYGKPSFAKSHRYINVDTSKYNYVYEVVDVVRVSCAAGSKDKMIYEKFAQINKKKVYNSWKKQVAKCRDKNYKKPLGKYTNKDRLVILSTCEYTKENGRLALICKQKKCVKVK